MQSTLFRTALVFGDSLPNRQLSLPCHRVIVHPQVAYVRGSDRAHTAHRGLSISCLFPVLFPILFISFCTLGQWQPRVATKPPHRTRWVDLGGLRPLGQPLIAEEARVTNPGEESIRTVHRTGKMRDAGARTGLKPRHRPPHQLHQAFFFSPRGQVHIEAESREIKARLDAAGLGTLFTRCCRHNATQQTSATVKFHRARGPG